MSYKILTYGDTVLRQKAQPVKVIDENIRQLAEDMLGTMYRANGIGLAGTQIGRSESICVIDISGVDKATLGEDEACNCDVKMPLVMINPQIVSMCGTQTGQEGCLSFPGIFVSVKRAADVGVRFRNLNDEEVVISVKGFLARAVQHEVDHLNGVLLVDRMSVAQKVAVAGKLKRLKNKNKES